jgi:hypothetical protein
MLEVFGSENARVVPEVNADGSSEAGQLQPQPRSTNQGLKDKLPKGCERQTEMNQRGSRDHLQ